MKDEIEGSKIPAPNLFQSMTGSAREAIQHGRETFSGALQHFSQSHPQITSQVYSVRQSATELLDKGKDLAAKRYDNTMQHFGVSSTNFGREQLKFKPNPDDWIHTRVQKGAANFVIDKVADNFETISRGATDFGGGIKDKVTSSTLDRLDPRHLTQLVKHPDLSKEYLSQRWNQVLQLKHLYDDPSDFAKTKLSQYKTTANNVYELGHGLDSGFRNKFAHGGRAFIDLTQETIAPVIGVGLSAFALYNIPPKHRQNTKQAMDSLFPKNTMYGKAARVFPVNFLFSKPLAKIKGNPRLSLAVLGYGALTGIGKSISESLDLQNKRPAIFDRLKSENRQMIHSGTPLNIHESIQKTSNDGRKK